VKLTADQRAELAALVNSADVSAAVATRARIVLWRAEDRPKVEIAALAGVSRPTVDLWLSRFAACGVSGLLDRRRGAPREQVPAAVRARVLALTRTSPPAETGLSHWSSRELAAFIQRTEGVYVSHHYVAKLWRETGLKPHRQGTFKLSKDPAFAAKVADVVGLYLDPPGGAVVLSIDEKTRAPRGADEAVRDERPAAGHRSDRSKLEADRSRVRGEIGSSLDNVGAGRNCQTARAR
jgi:transposase